MEDKKKEKLVVVEEKVGKIIKWIEVILAIMILIAVLLSGKDLISIIYNVYTTEALNSYGIFQKFLSHLLLLVVGLELALMLIKHTPANVLEVMLYAIARKMLIYTNTTTDILIGVIALGLVFIIDKYFHTRDTKKVIK